MRNALLKLAGLGAAGAVLTGLYARYIEPRWVQTVHLDLFLPDHYAELSGLSIGFVTDTHVGPHFSLNDLDRTTRIVERERPDILIFGGDFLSESPLYLRGLQHQLTRMVQSARLGAWGIWGNHDLANLRDRVAPVLADSGITILTNESARVETGQGDLWLGGVDDLLLGKADPARTFADVPADAPLIALWHEPDGVARLTEWHPLVILSGHTHGGQVRLPFVGPLATPDMGKTYVAGGYLIGNTQLYVSRGIGMYRPPVRFNCRPEVTFIHLSRRTENALPGTLAPSRN